MNPKQRLKALASKAQAVVDDDTLTQAEKASRMSAIEAEISAVRADIAEEDHLNAQRARAAHLAGATSLEDHLDGPSGSFGQAVEAAGFDLKNQRSVTIAGTTALGIRNAVTLTGAAPETWAPTSPGVVPLAADRRFIYPVMPTTNAGEATAVTDFEVTARTLTGTVQRAVDATTTKAILGNTIVHSVDEIPQHAVVVEGIPNQLLESVPMMRQIFEQEARLAVAQSIDEHVYAALTAAAPNGDTGTGRIAQIREAIAVMRAAGMNPNVLIIDPSEAVELDLAQDGSGRYLFDLDSANNSSPLFGLRIVESVAAVGADPLLVDTSRIGMLYVGTIKIDADPYSGFKENLTDLRVETNALMHVRDATAAYRIGATA